MKVLIAEDETDIAKVYRRALRRRGHDVVLTKDGEECLAAYRHALDSAQARSDPTRTDTGQQQPPFDVVVLDYKMPKKDGLQAAREILDLFPEQRIIFASAYVKDTLEESVKELRQVVELMQKPFEAELLADVIEDIEVWDQVKHLIVGFRQAENRHIDEESLIDIFQRLKKIQKGRTF